MILYHHQRRRRCIPGDDVDDDDDATAEALHNRSLLHARRDIKKEKRRETRRVAKELFKEVHEIIFKEYGERRRVQIDNGADKGLFKDLFSKPDEPKLEIYTPATMYDNNTKPGKITPGTKHSDVRWDSTGYNITNNKKKYV